MEPIYSKKANCGEIITKIHVLLMTSKLSHYATKSYAQHEAFGRTYESLNGISDSITEKLLGYENESMSEMNIGNIKPMAPKEMATQIMKVGVEVESYGSKNNFCDIENLGQELSGIGAQLSYLSRFS